ncbi:RNA-guided endonuclease InsQ/TnpB family protein [Planktothrix mougeotii]|uniref:RNA-guided endonuclease InsQ/TnpB family protein n=1 Tax=Planktothrix mougeotii TaxID=54306 RepID=UPI003241C314
MKTRSKEIGLDVGIESFYTDSNGYQEVNPKFLRKAEQSIKQSQKQIYKKVKGSSGRRKARKVYAKKHLKVSRQRIEHAKRIARNVCKSNDLVVYEDLIVKNLVKNHCLAKSISDVSWYLLRKWIEYFAAKFDKSAIPVAPHYTSQKCSNCGVIVKKSLSTRTHVCNCGCELHRDTNAAINILNLGKQARGGHPQSNANGLETSTPLDESLVEQVSRLKLESPPSEDGLPLVVFTTIVRKTFPAKKDIPNSKKIAVPLNIKHRDGNYTQPKDKLP